MNAHARKRLVPLLAIAGANLGALSVVILAGIKNPALLAVLASLAGTLGYHGFNKLGAVLLDLDKRHKPGVLGKVIYPFRELPDEEAAAAGGKGKALARLSQAGYPVPDGFILLPAAFAGDELAPEAWEQARGLVARLRRKDRQASFAVRSSALSEDSAQSSFAGEFESILDVREEEAIRQAIASVRRSRHSERAQAYARNRGVEERDLEMAVIVQRLVPADFSGVLFTADPLTGNLSQMTGNYGTGLGEKLVSGQVSPRTFTFTRPKGGYQGPAELRQAARALYRNANGIERDCGAPQDIEWAVAGGRLFILQARPITTLNAYDPMGAQWNDTFSGNFLWSGTNLMEACPAVMTPFTASLRPYLDARGGPTLSVRNHALNGVIGGRFYANLSVQISVFLPFFGGDAHRAYREMAGWWGEVPDDLEIPTIPLTWLEWLEEVLPVLSDTGRQLGKYRKGLAAFVAEAPRRCREMRQQIGQVSTKEALVALWENTLSRMYSDSIYSIVAASSDAPVRLEKELRALVSAEEATALLSNLSGASSRLESLGPVTGLGKVLRGEMSRAAYLEAYGHRGENEGECAWPRPLEDPAWLDRQLAEFAKTAVDSEALLAHQHAASQAAWERFCQRYPGKAKRMCQKIEKAAVGARQREAVRSEATRVSSLVRTFALRAGEMLGLGEEVFYLTITETLAALQGKSAALALIPGRQEAHRRYSALPPYPTLICGRFDPLHWAADPRRRSDLYDARTPNKTDPGPDTPTVQGFAGALGVVEGNVRRLERLEESSQLQAGEILVTPMTNIGWTPLFPRAAAIVTDLGAPLSHAAIVARELGIPAVVGCGDATMRLKTGDRVRVDGGRGRVEILQRAA